MSEANTEEQSSPQAAPMAIGDLNTLVIEYPIDIAVQTFYDLDLEETWDDKCILWTVEDDGAKYKEEIPLTDTSAVTAEEKNIMVLFKKVPTDYLYSCVIDQGEGKTVTLFQNLNITEDMAYTEE